MLQVRFRWYFKLMKKLRNRRVRFERSCRCDENSWWNLDSYGVSVSSSFIKLIMSTFWNPSEHCAWAKTETPISQSSDSDVLFLMDPWLSRPKINNSKLCACVADREPTRIFLSLPIKFPRRCAIQNSFRAPRSQISRLVVLNGSPTLPTIQIN